MSVDGPKLVIFVENTTGSSLRHKADWLGADTKWDGDSKQVVEERGSFSLSADREMGGVLCFTCFGELLCIGFQSEKCPNLNSEDVYCNGVPPNLLAEWMELHRQFPQQSFVTMLGRKPVSIDALVKTFGQGVSVVAKFWLSQKTLLPSKSVRDSSGLSTPAMSRASSSDSAPEGAQDASDSSARLNKKPLVAHPKSRVRKRDALKSAKDKFLNASHIRMSGIRKQDAETPSQPSQASPAPSKAIDASSTTKFLEKAKTILDFGKSSADEQRSMEALAKQMDVNRELGEKKRAEAKAVFQQCLSIAINIDRFRNWTDQQKFAFGQMTAMCLAKLFKKHNHEIGNYPEVRAILEEQLVQRHKDLMIVMLGLVAVPPELLESIVQQYEVMHVTDNTEKIPDASIFLEPLAIESDIDKWCLLRDLTALLLAAGCFDTRAVSFLKLLAEDISVSPEAVDEWASDAGQNLWEAYQSQKGDKESSVSGWKVGLWVAVGGLTLGATGGLALFAAPAALGAVGSALGGGVTAAASFVGLQGAGAAAATALTGAFASTAAFFTAVGPAAGTFLFGATGMTLTGYKLANRWGDLSNFDFVPVRPLSNITSITVWVDALIEEINLRLEDGSIITYGYRSDSAESISVVFAEKPQNEYIVGVCGTAARSSDAKGLCESLKIRSNLGRSKRFAGSAYNTSSANGKPFRFAAKEDQAIVGLDFNNATCVRVYSTSVEAMSTATQESAVNWTLFISGWVINQSDFRAPWMKVRGFFPTSDHFCLEWENENVIRLGHFLGDRIKSEIGEFAARAWVKTTVAAVGGAAIVWPWFVTKSLVDLDNDWILVMERAKLAGRCLATVLADSQGIGNRPVTLCGHSMGAVVVFHCLLELYELKKFHVVKEVILLGSPIPINSTSVSTDTEMWSKARSVVEGRFVNGYSGSDWLLAFLFRYMEWRLFVAGLQPVDGVPGIENVDLTAFVNSHEDYPKKSDLILHYIGFY
eukprot:GEMP01010814.1.p1 GENE.GEMP01010814.1~~GEMP01010814.1.p1  ORF type:complete len:986 (+),score=172.92 GEMP01010814.1:81-3038(+)